MRPKLNGWHRLWVLGSALYLIGIGFVSYGAHPKENTIYAKWAADVLAAIADDSNKGQAQKFTAEEFRASESLRHKTDKEIVIEFTQAAKRVDLSKPEKADLARFRQRILETESRHQRDLRKLKSEQVSIVLFYGALWIFPSLIFLAFGYAIAWVLRGFKSERPNKAPEPTPGSVTPRATERSSK